MHIISVALCWLYLRALAFREERLRPDDAGQATAEYALVLLGAAAIALLVVSWATRTNVVGRLLDTIFGQLLARTK
jgi:Flp pilus assembly pilin Flp